MSKHFKSAEYVPKKQLVNVRSSANTRARAMRARTPSFIARHTKSILTVSNEMMRQSMVMMAIRPCTEPMTRLVR
jgi:hypothetical protein